MAFDPDAYLGIKPKEDEKNQQVFDPDAYLSKSTPPPAQEQGPSAMTALTGFVEGDERPFGERFAESRVGTAEQALSMLTGSLGEIAGGWAGLLSAPFVGADEAANNVRRVSDALTYEPKTESGKAQQKAIGRFLSPVAEWLSEKPGDAAFNLAQTPEFRDLAMNSGVPLLRAMATNPEVAGTLGATAPTAILEVMGLKGLSKAKTAKEARQVLADEINRGDINIDNIVNAVDADGRLTRNMRTKEVVRLYDDEVKGKQAAITFESLSPDDRAATLEMLDMIENGRRRGRVEQITNRPSDVIGRAVEDRVRRVEQLRKQASKQMNQAIGRNRKTQVDINEEGVGFLNFLESQGVDITRNNRGRYKVDFSDSNLSTGDGISAQKVEQLLNRLDQGERGFGEVHGIKQLAQDIVNYNPNSITAPPTAALENAIKGVAANLNAKLRNIDADYAAANDIYSASNDSYRQAQRYLKNIDLDDALARTRFGNLSKRIASNFSSRDDLIMMIDGLENVLTENGVPVRGNITSQVAALADLEDIFKIERQQSPFGLQGRVQAAQEAAAAATDPTGISGVRGAARAIDALRGMRTADFDERMRILRKILKEQRQ